ncbi:hypothetical protein PTSG_12504 [Salpingoeca rosetta]|uniref:Peroxisomal membrane protein PEX13 n=1 Tax=Salpingoeca rosetta (strain ATCC 50818 / BSB-021) TaxID=946362 RepID=F2UF41_SALR5|nr:uncharacterized protein PTSG_12504 [Salpingoeca rosetta]EGD75241.1 hypothetical protein PTSG_12504 [Salpingoeca rosetta]|eukprot:XP_004992294.1 hypothetical protein PTSG_12504 [Salpingoeca rosetta]
MASPPKPWEVAGSGHAASVAPVLPSPPPSASATATGIPNDQQQQQRRQQQQALPPPVPTRGYGGTSGMRFMNGLGGASPYYNSYGGYHPHHARFGYGSYRDGPDGSLFQQMQEGGRGAFETVERLVFAVSSVAAMLESSYDALYSSFMAVVSVADHMDQLKEQLLSVFKSLVRLRFLKRIIAKLMRLFRLTPPAFLLEPDTLPTTNGQSGGRFPWPLIVFFALVFGSPLVVYSMMRKQKKDSRRPVRARVAWDYTAQKNDELTIVKDTIVTVYPPKSEPEGWVTAEAEDGSKGYVHAASYNTRRRRGWR